MRRATKCIHCNSPIYWGDDEPTRFTGPSDCLCEVPTEFKCKELIPDGEDHHKALEYLQQMIVVANEFNDDDLVYLLAEVRSQCKTLWDQVAYA